VWVEPSSEEEKEENAMARYEISNPIPLELQELRAKLGYNK
jgi:hypothetical protein